MDSRISEAIRSLERSMAHEVRIADIAENAGLSLHHFHRLFLAEVGEPPASFLRRLRLDAAALRLKWTDEPGVEIAHAFGFHSRSAFIRAFSKRFGKSPAQYRREYRTGSQLVASEAHGQRMYLQEQDSFRLLTRRYAGDPFQLSTFWADFLTGLPPELTLPGKRLYVGLLHDDFRITGSRHVRYDCGITITGMHEDSSGYLTARGLELTTTHPGRYGAIEHRGPAESVPDSYDLLQRRLFTPQGYRPGNEPALEVHTIARNLQDKADLSFTILMPVD